MPETVGEVFVALRPDDSRLQPEMQSALTKALGPVVATGAKILAGLFVGKQALGFARAGINELEDAEKQSALTAAQIRATGGAAGESLAHIQDLAAANLALAGTDDEVTIAAARVLLQFNRITAAGGIFDETLRSAQDLAIATGQDLPGATRALGLALQDPLHATRLLRGENVALNTAQQEQIKNFVASGNIMGAQRVILDQVRASVGGVAASYGQTLGGDLQRAQEELKNTRASLIEGAAPALTVVADASTALSEEIQGLPSGLRTVIGSVLLLGSAAATITPLVSSAVQGFRAIQGARGASTDAAAAVVKTTLTEATAAQTEATVALMIAQSGQTATAEALAAAEAMLAASNRAVAESEAAVGAAAGGTAVKAAAGGAVATLGVLAAAVTLVGGAYLYGKSKAELFGLSLHGQVPTIDEFTSRVGAIKAAADLSGRSLADVAGGIAAQSIPAARNFNDALRAQGLSTDEVTAAIDKQDQANKAALAGLQGLTAAEYDEVTVQNARFEAISGSVTAQQAYLRSLKDVESAQRSAQSAARSLTVAQRALDKALIEQGSAHEVASDELAVAQARLGSTAAAKTLKDEEAKLQQLRHGMSGTTAELTSAETSLAAARESQRRASQSLAELERSARINARRGIAETHEQRLAIAEAGRSAQDAAKNTATEEAKLRVLRAPGTAQQVADQEQKVAAAKIATQQATFAVTDAESALQVVQAQGSASDQAVIDSRQRVADASQGVTDANDRVKESYANVVAASAAYRDAQDALAGTSVTATTKANNLRSSLAAIANTYAPGSAERKNIEDEIALLDQLLGRASVGGAVSGAFGGGDNGVADWFARLFGIKAAGGFAGTVTRPTGILAGEGGRPEDVLIVPHSQGGIQTGSGGGVAFGPGSVVVNFHGVVPTADEARRTGQAVGAGINDKLTENAVRLARKIA